MRKSNRVGRGIGVCLAALLGVELAAACSESSGGHDRDAGGFDASGSGGSSAGGATSSGGSSAGGATSSGGSSAGGATSSGGSSQDGGSTGGGSSKGGGSTGGANATDACHFPPNDGGVGGKNASVDGGTVLGKPLMCGTAAECPQVVTTIASDVAILTVAMDSTSVYWGSIGCPPSPDAGPTGPTGVVMKGPIGGGQPTILSNRESWPKGIVVDSTHVYWFEQTSVPLDWEIFSVPIDGGAVTLLASHLHGLNDIAVDGKNVYWTSLQGTGSDGGDTPFGAVMSAPLGGGKPVTLATGSFSPQAIAVDHDSVYWLEGSGDPAAMDGAVRKVPLAGGSPTTLASGLPLPLSPEMVLNGTHVYFTTDNAVMRVPITGGAVTTIAMDPTPATLYFDAKNVYYLTTSGGLHGSPSQSAVKSVPLDGGASTTIVPGGCGLVAVNGTSVYCNAYDRIVRRTPGPCEDGVCKCEGAKSACAGSPDGFEAPYCADLSTDLENCGACGNSCPLVRCGPQMYRCRTCIHGVCGGA